MSMPFFNIGYSVLLKEKNIWKLALGYIKCPEIRGFLEISHSCFHQKFNIIFFKTKMLLYKRCFFGKFPQTQRTKARIKILKEKKTAWTFEQTLFVENEPITEKTKLTHFTPCSIFKYVKTFRRRPGCLLNVVCTFYVLCLEGRRTHIPTHYLLHCLTYKNERMTVLVKIKCFVTF